MNKFESNKPVGWTEAQKNGKGKKKRGSRGKGTGAKDSIEEKKNEKTSSDTILSPEFNYCPTCGTPTNQTRKKRRYQKDLQSDGKYVNQRGLRKPRSKDSTIVGSSPTQNGGRRRNKKNKKQSLSNDENTEEMDIAVVCAELCKDSFLLEESVDVENQRKNYRMLEGRREVATIEDLNRLVKAFAKLSGRVDGLEWCEVEIAGNKLLEVTGFNEIWEKTEAYRTLPVLWEIGSYLVNYIRKRQDVKKGEEIDVKTWFQISSLPINDPLRQLLPRGQIIDEATWYLDCRGLIRESWDN